MWGKPTLQQVFEQANEAVLVHGADAEERTRGRTLGRREGKRSCFVTDAIRDSADSLPNIFPALRVSSGLPGLGRGASWKGRCSIASHLQHRAARARGSVCIAASRAACHPLCLSVCVGAAKPRQNVDPAELLQPLSSSSSLLLFFSSAVSLPFPSPSPPPFSPRPPPRALLQPALLSASACASSCRPPRYSGPSRVSQKLPLLARSQRAAQACGPRIYLSPSLHDTPRTIPWLRYFHCWAIDLLYRILTVPANGRPLALLRAAVPCQRWHVLWSSAGREAASAQPGPRASVR